MATALKTAVIFCFMSVTTAQNVNPDMLRAKLESTPYRLRGGLNEFAHKGCNSIDILPDRNHVWRFETCRNLYCRSTEVFSKLIPKPHPKS